MLDSLLKVYSQLDLAFSIREKDNYNTAYDGETILVNNSALCHYRQAKVTPKKIGQFVTLWEKDPSGKNKPYSSDTQLDFLIVTTILEDRLGQFIFPRSVLIQRKIISTPVTNGKMGFRVYPDWDTPTSLQGTQTKNWQKPYFVDLTSPTDKTKNKLFSLFNFEQ